MSLCGGAYCAAYTIDGQRFRAVLDTGSPFLLVDGTCAAGEKSPWGCYRGQARPSGLGDTDELYGGEDVSVEWRRGSFIFEQIKVDDELRLTAAFPDAVFGVVRGYVGKGGGGAIFLGLCKQRLPRIRPSLLEQTDIASMRFDFYGRRLELSRSSLIPSSSDAVRLIDLRPRGAPVANFAARCSSLVINNQKIQLPFGKKIVVVVDTGTTGISVDERLFESLPIRWLDASIELPTENGDSLTLSASVRRRQRKSSSKDGGSSQAQPERSIPIDAEEFDEFPLVVSPITVPWFDPGFGEQECADNSGLQCNGRPLGAPKPLIDRIKARADGLGDAPYVLFVGLAFLWKRTLTIDVDARRMTVA